jgi:hypothetical protein
MQTQRFLRALHTLDVVEVNALLVDNAALAKQAFEGGETPLHVLVLNSLQSRIVSAVSGAIETQTDMDSTRLQSLNNVVNLLSFYGGPSIFFEQNGNGLLPFHYVCMFGTPTSAPPFCAKKLGSLVSHQAKIRAPRVFPSMTGVERINSIAIACLSNNRNMVTWLCDHAKPRDIHATLRLLEEKLQADDKDRISDSISILKDLCEQLELNLDMKKEEKRARSTLPNAFYLVWHSNFDRNCSQITQETRALLDSGWMVVGFGVSRFVFRSYREETSQTRLGVEFFNSSVERKCGYEFVSEAAELPTIIVCEESPRSSSESSRWSWKANALERLVKTILRSSRKQLAFAAELQRRLLEQADGCNRILTFDHPACQDRQLPGWVNETMLLHKDLWLKLVGKCEARPRTIQSRLRDLKAHIFRDISGDPFGSFECLLISSDVRRCFENHCITAANHLASCVSRAQAIAADTSSVWDNSSDDEAWDAY